MVFYLNIREVNNFLFKNRIVALALAKWDGEKTSI